MLLRPNSVVSLFSRRRRCCHIDARDDRRRKAKETHSSIAQYVVVGDVQHTGDTDVREVKRPNMQ